MTATKRRAWTVSGPDVDKGYVDGGGVALSGAITFASRATGEVTYYVRTPEGDPFGRVERDADGVIAIYRKEGAR